MIKQRKSLLLVIVGGLLPSLAALAEPRVTTSPGMVCRASGSVPASYGTDSVMNDSSSSLPLSCPLSTSVRDNKHFLTQTSFLAAGGGVGCSSTGSEFNPAVTITDRNATANASCTLYVLGSGNNIVASFNVSTSGQSATPQRLTWPVPRMDFTGMRLYADCLLPPRDVSSGVVSSIQSFTLFTCDP
jgi:hypothetical protein